MPKKNKCLLCHREGQDLQDSHFLPAGVYRVVRSESSEGGSPNPIIFDSEGAVQTSSQIKDYVFCAECEQRLNRNGEAYFLKYCWRRDGFRLHAILDAAAPSVAGRIKVYAAAKFPEIDVNSLAYFGASMFWRDSVHHWKTKKSGSEQIELGPYEEQFRTYLMGETAFPENCALWISVPDTITRLTPLSLTPYGGSSVTNGVRLYKLVVLGVGFLLFVGRALTAEHRQLCSVRGAGNPLYKTDLQEEAITKDLFQLFTENPSLAAGPK